MTPDRTPAEIIALTILARDGVTVIATFNANDQYEGHAAIYVSQDDLGLRVYDQYIYGRVPKAVGPRTLRFGAQGDANNGDKFFVVEQ